MVIEQKTRSFCAATRDVYKRQLPFGAMGVIISGSTVYNPYEGDGTTVAMNANFTIPNQKG